MSLGEDSCRPSVCLLPDLQPIRGQFFADRVWRSGMLHGGGGQHARGCGPYPQIWQLSHGCHRHRKWYVARCVVLVFCKFCFAPSLCILKWHEVLHSFSHILFSLTAPVNLVLLHASSYTCLWYFFLLQLVKLFPFEYEQWHLLIGRVLSLPEWLWYRGQSSFEM